jgi:hypothetical protein
MVSRLKEGLQVLRSQRNDPGTDSPQYLSTFCCIFFQVGGVDLIEDIAKGKVEIIDYDYFLAHEDIAAGTRRNVNTIFPLLILSPPNAWIKSRLVFLLAIYIHLHSFALRS